MSDKTEVTINQRTLMPISLVITLMSAVIWISTIYFKVDAQGAQIQKNDDRIESHMKILIEIRERLIRIEERLK